MRRIVEDAKPEAAYFCEKDGKRRIPDRRHGGHLADALLAEAWFLRFDAPVELLPAMTPQDLQRAGLERIDAQRGWRRLR
jgi:hypothetical protein